MQKTRSQVQLILHSTKDHDAETTSLTYANVENNKFEDIPHPDMTAEQCVKSKEIGNTPNLPPAKSRHKLGPRTPSNELAGGINKPHVSGEQLTR